MQKLVTIYLSSENNQEVQEHLSEYTKEGWRVVSMCSVGTYSAASFSGAAGFLSVLLEKDAS